jgi:hypothetical protein
MCEFKTITKPIMIDDQIKAFLGVLSGNLDTNDPGFEITEKYLSIEIKLSSSALECIPKY